MRRSNNILLAPHPSPLSSYRVDFLARRPFSEINNILLKSNNEQIDWQIDLVIKKVFCAHAR